MTTDAPHRTTSKEIRLHRVGGVVSRSARFGLPVASVLVIDGVVGEEATGWHVDLSAPTAELRRLFTATLQFLVTESTMGQWGPPRVR